MTEWGIERQAVDAERAAGAEQTGELPERFAVFDPCASREYPELQTSVRALLDLCETEWENLPFDGEKARCCGYGGHVAIAAPNHRKRVVYERSRESELPYLTYCVNCRESFAEQGKEVFHFLDLLFGLNGAHRPSVTVTERRKQRLLAKRELLRTYWKEEWEEEPEMKLIVEPELERKLSESQILISDMEQVIEHCEREGRGVLDPETGRTIGHLKIQNLTYWAEYEVLEDGGFKLWNGYSHRMKLEGEE